MSISIFVACSSDDNDDNGATIEPTQARSFISDYFSAYDYNSVLINNFPDEKGTIYIAQMFNRFKLKVS